MVREETPREGQENKEDWGAKMRKKLSERKSQTSRRRKVAKKARKLRG